MKKTYLKLILVLVVAVIFSSCNSLKKMKENSSKISYKTTPELLEMHNDEVEVMISGVFPAKYFQKKAIVIVTPTLVNDDKKELKLESVTVQGEKVVGNDNVILYIDGGSFKYTSKIKYSPEFDKSKLVLKVIAKMPNKSQKVGFEDIDIASGIIKTPALAEKKVEMIIASDYKSTHFGYSADIHYLINKSDIRSAELEQEDLKNLSDKVKTKYDNKEELLSIEISSYASPDGTERLNKNLAGNRSKSAEKWLNKQLEQLEIEVAEEKITSKATPEDWNGFKREMEKSNIADKNLILRVLTMYSDPEKREKEIKNISKAYNEITEIIMPKLRRSMIKINFGSSSKSTADVILSAIQNPEELTQEQFLNTPLLINDFAKQETMYLKYISMYPKDWRGYNDLSCLYVENGQNDKAEKMLKKAEGKEFNNSTIKNNLGVIEFYKGNYDEAEEIFSNNPQSDKSSENAAYQYIRTAKYNDAVNALSNKCTFNSALANLLAKKYTAAEEKINCSEEKNIPMSYYLKAIINARTDNQNKMFDNLKKAIQKDSKLKELAKKDAEFTKYFDNQSFKLLMK